MCGGEAFAGLPGLRGVAAGIPEEDTTAGLACEDLVFVLAAGEVVPALRTDHHLARGTFVVDGFGEAAAFRFCDAIVVGESRFADLRAEGGALGFDAGDAGAGAFESGGGAGALGVECGAVGVDGRGGGFLGGLEGLGALERGEFFVFELADGGLGEVDLVLEGVDLRGAGGGVHLFAQASDLGAVSVGVELLASAKFFFCREILADFSESLFCGLEGGFGGGDAPWSFGLILAKALELEVLSLEDDEMFEVSVHVPLWVTHCAVCGVPSKD